MNFPKRLLASRPELATAGQGEILWRPSSFCEEEVGSGPVRAWGGGVLVAYGPGRRGHALWDVEGACHGCGGHSSRGTCDSHILTHSDTSTLRHARARQDLPVVGNDVVEDESSRAGYRGAMAGDTLANRLAIGMTSGGKHLGGIFLGGSVKDP